MTTLLAVATTQPLLPGVLTADESAHLAALADEERRRQWLTSRRALRLLLALSGFPPDTTKYTFPHRRMSLSHTESVGAAVVLTNSPDCVVAGVGIDVESDRAHDPRGARFFLGERAQDWLDTLPSAERRHHQVSLWAAKEAVFKADTYNGCAALWDYTLVDPSAAAGCAVRKQPPGEPASGRAVHYGYIRTWLRGIRSHLAIAVALRPQPTPCTSANEPTGSKSRRNMSVPEEITFDNVAERISATLAIPRTKLRPATKLAELGADSFMLVEAIVDLQEEFDTMFSQIELREVANLGELVELLQRSRVTSGS